MSNLETLAISISSLDCYAVVKKRCILLFSNAKVSVFDSRGIRHPLNAKVFDGYLRLPPESGGDAEEFLSGV